MLSTEQLQQLAIARKRWLRYKDRVIWSKAIREAASCFGIEISTGHFDDWNRAIDALDKFHPNWRDGKC